MRLSSLSSFFLTSKHVVPYISTIYTHLFKSRVTFLRTYLLIQLYYRVKKRKKKRNQPLVVNCPVFHRQF